MKYLLTSRAGWGRRSGSKPPVGAVLSPVVACDPAIVVLFNEGGPSILTSTSRNLLPGNYGTRGYLQPRLSDTGGGASFIKWNNGPGGLGVQGTVANFGTGNVDLAWQFSPALDGGMNLKLDRVTVLVIRSKTDTTANASGLFGFNANTPFNIRCGAHTPYSDGIVYFDFGGASGLPNRITWSGYTRSTNVESWAFRAGGLGSSIWFQGNKVASQSTPVTRTAAAAGVIFRCLGGNFAGSDSETIYFFALCNDELPDAAIQQWYADPYGFFFAPQNAGVRGKGFLHTTRLFKRLTTQVIT